MLHDANAVESGARLSADVCIVGAGAAGIACAVELADSDISVALLESGGLSRDQDTHDLNQGESVGLPYAALEACRSRFLGGSTNCWGGWSRPFEAADLTPRAWLAESGWPLSAEELEPHYRRATELLELGSFDYDPSLLRRLERDHARVLSLREERVVTQMLRFSPPSRFGTLHRARLRDAPNIRCLLHANVTEILTDPSGARAHGVEVATLQGVRFRVDARCVVLAAGGIENARLLLLSTKAATNGLGNHHDLVGRYFMEHPAWYAGRLVGASDPPLDLYDSRFNYHNPRFTIDGSRVAAYLTLSDALQRDEELLRHRVFFHTMYPGDGSEGMEALRRLTHRSRFVERSADPWRDTVRLLRDAPRVATAIAARLTSIRRFGTPWMMAIVEPEPTRESRVELADTRDALGLRRARVSWRLTDRVTRTFQRACDVVGGELARAGLATVEPSSHQDDNPMWCWHHIGTTRMSDDPRRGVVDRDGVVHGTSNLYVTGSSVFPTAGTDMPTLTIVALAVRSAKTLRKRLDAREI